MRYMEYIIIPIVILVFYNIFTREKISFVNNIVAFVLLGGGFFVVDTFDGYLYYIAIIILATVVVSIDYLLSKKEKTWRDELTTFSIIVVISFFFGLLSMLFGLVFSDFLWICFQFNYFEGETSQLSHFLGRNTNCRRIKNQFKLWERVRCYYEKECNFDRSPFIMLF